MFSTSHTSRLGAAVAAVAATALLLASAESRAAGPRPLFQMPVPCGQTWDASTYEKHWNGDQDAIDLAQRDPDDANISEGEPALASAAGTIAKVYTADNGEHRVFIDHGGGWRTDYIHLESVPPLKVGQRVAQGEVVGRISNSGADTMHLHYNQISDGKAVQIHFNGKAIKTGAADKSTWGTWGSDDAEELTSLNCPANTFASFNQNGFRYQFLYKPSSGQTKVVRLDTDGKGVASVWSGEWSQQWSQLVPFTLSGGQQHLFAYKAATGEMKFDRINPQAQGTTTLGQGSWWKGWTNVTSFSLGGKPYLLAYDSLHGYVNVDRINGEGSGSTKVFGSTWTKGWTHVTPYEHGNGQYVLLYKSGTGKAKIVELKSSGATVSVTTTWSGTWLPGWTHVVPFWHKGARHVFAYRVTDGTAWYGKLASNGKGVQHLGFANWTGTWTAITPFLQDGNGALLIYGLGSGTVETRVLNPAGTGSTSMWVGRWTKNWT